jgi:chromosome segregation ATPase
MLQLSTKDYDLNTLFSFESLKEILIELAKSQLKMENELKNIQEGNKERDNTILELKSIINNYNINDENKNSQNDDNIGQDKDKKEIQKAIENSSDSNKVIKKEKTSERDKNNVQMDSNEVGDNIDKKDKETQNISNNEGMKDKSEDDDNNKIPSFLLMQINKQIKEHKIKIDSLEENMKNHSENIKNGENQLKNLTLESQNELKSLNDKVNSLLKINNQLELKLESLESNMQGFDIMKMFRDDGSGTVDASRVMVKALQEKVFKKFELVEARYKRDGEENMKTKSLVENILPKIEKITKDLESINELNQHKNEENVNIKNINHELTDEIKNAVIDDLGKKLEKLKEEIHMDMNNNIKAIEDKLSIMSTEEKDSIKLLDKKISELRKKLNNLENTIKFHLKEDEIENIKNDIKDI